MPAEKANTIKKFIVYIRDKKYIKERGGCYEP